MSGFRALGDDDRRARNRAGQRRAEVLERADRIKNLSPPRFLIIADAFAKTVALARDEREVNAVFDVVEPFAANSRRPAGRRFAGARCCGSLAKRCSPSIVSGPRRGRGEAGRAAGPPGA